MADLTVWCLLVNHKKEATFGDAFEVDVPPDADAGDLKELIKEKCPDTLKHINAAKLTVWRCTDSAIDFGYMSPGEYNARLEEVFSPNEKKVKKLRPEQEVGQFPEDSTLLIEVPGKKDTELSEESEDTPSELSAVTRRDRTLSTFKETISVCNDDGVRRAHERLFTGRISDRYGHTVALFHQELALLQHRLQMLDAQVKTGQDWGNPRTTTGGPDSSRELTDALLQAARTYFYESLDLEESQWLTTQAFFEQIFGTMDMKQQNFGNGRKKQIRERSLKGIYCANAVWGKYAILENGNAPGLTGDASLQAAVWYGKLCRSSKGIYRHSKMPAILIGVMGNVLEVSIAVCLEEILVDKILYFEVVNSVHYNETIVKLALMASALKACADKLRTEYKDLEQTSACDPVGEETWHLPCPSAASPSRNSSIPAVKFTGKLSRSNQKLIKTKGKNSEMRPLFLATYHDQEVVVKFSVTYGIDAHHALADQKYAPKLHFCEQVISRQQMVVMDRVDGKPMYKESRQSLPRSVFEDLEKAMKIMHDKGLVFGDLRDTNVMITKSDGKVGAKLVDFEWADLEGKGRYPALINKDLIGTELDPDIRPLGFMYKKHDEYALGKLISEYCEDTVYREAKCEELRRSSD